MTITVTEDIISGSSITLTASGYSGTKVYKARSDDGPVTLTEVIQHDDIPDYGDQFSTVTGAPLMYALEISAQPDNEQNTVFVVTVNYGIPDFNEKPPSEDESDAVQQVGSSVTSSKTQKDKDGNQIVVSLTGEEDQVGDLDIQVPETVLVFERRESSNPITKSLNNAGKVNSVALGSGTYAVRTLLCLGIEGISTDDGDTWQVTYRFQYRPDTWDALAVYIDPETDRPHDDIDLDTAGAGWVEVEIYDTADFSTLSLPF